MSKTLGDGSWGHLADTEHFGRKCCSSDYISIRYEDADLPQYENCTTAGHCMLYSRHNDKVFGLYDSRAAVLMQMRFDGYLGFPGGLIDAGESTVTGVNRELVEELNLDMGKMSVKQSDYIFSHWNDKAKLILHFYALEVPFKDFEDLEKNALVAEDFGTEVMGIVRVPLYTMGDGYRGFPAFLSNSFAGNSRQQLLQSLIRCQIMTQEETQRAVNAKPS